MTYWIYPWNSEFYDLYGCLGEFGFIEWRQRNKVSVGDIVLLYACAPIFRAVMIFEIKEINIAYSDRATSKYGSSKTPTQYYSKLIPISYLDSNNPIFSREHLLQLGMPKNLQAAVKAKADIIELITDNMGEDESAYLAKGMEFEEGAVSYRLHKEYERNALARAECLKLKGYSCHICGMNFERTYGNIGKGFIEVHHVEFLSKSKGTVRKTDIAEHLIPVCSNCHSMLHRKIDSCYLQPEELKQSIKD